MAIAMAAGVAATCHNGPLFSNGGFANTGVPARMAIEWGKQGVRVNAVAPGLIQTDMTSYAWNSEAGPAYVARRIPVGRIGQPRDIGGAVVFLASEAADFIHGETIAVDGGFLAT